MAGEELHALSALTFDWVVQPDDVWRDSPFHVDGLHGDVPRVILAGLDEARRSTGPNPPGIAIQGQPGAGKTHLLGWVRERVQRDEGYFFLVHLHDGIDFWESTLYCLLDGLARPTVGTETQLTVFLRRLAAEVGLPRSLQDAVAGELRLSRESIDIFVAALHSRFRYLGLECQDTVRALVLHASSDFAAQDVGYAYLQAKEEMSPEERAVWGMRRGRKPPQLLVRDLSRLLALTGPSVVAFDQLDHLSLPAAALTHGEEEPGAGDYRQVELLANGLMVLREQTQRTLCLVSCLPQTWILIRHRGVQPAAARFRAALQLETIPSAATGQELIEKRFSTRFREIGFDPKYPTWPIRPDAFAGATQFTARGLLTRVDAHIQSCLSSGTVSELASLDGWQGSGTGPAPEPPRDEMAELDERFRTLCENADISAALHRDTEDSAMPALLAAGLTAWIEERGGHARLFSLDPPPSAKPQLHARLRRTLDAKTEDELHWAFRAIASPNAVAALNRLRAACTMAGIHPGATKRRLFILRNDDWPTGQKNREARAALAEAGGRIISVDVEDLKRFAALRDLLTERPALLRDWLANRRPASTSTLFTTTLADAAGDDAAPVENTDPPTPDNSGARGPSEPSERHSNTPITIGVRVEDGALVRIELEALRKHTVIFAGSGSGKTVLIRRLIEECAVAGVSAIVLDPNNDLARLGDAWPAPPQQWQLGDPDRAAHYLANTDVVIWTPRREGGRPISFQPLPDFASVLDDGDEFHAAIDAAVAMLAPRAKVDGAAVKAERGRAVLREALTYFARQGRQGLAAYVELLADLPEGVSALAKGDTIAADMAETLMAAMVNDPLFGGRGQPVDPGLLLTPPPGKRARISVISFVGLPSDDQRQSFVNQLQMALFAWIKKHPAGDRPLGGLFVMDEAQTLAPSGAMTACTQSTIALASQARKYGLGLVFATQAPKGLHNRIPGNAATQLFGFLNSPTQIAAAKEMAQAKGSEVPDISRLRTGQFYLAGEGIEFQKIQTPMCLSHHPKSPLSTEEVIARARGST